MTGRDGAFVEQLVNKTFAEECWWRNTASELRCVALEAGTRLSLGQIRIHGLFFLVDGLHVTGLRHSERAPQMQCGERGG